MPGKSRAEANIGHGARTARQVFEELDLEHPADVDIEIIAQMRGVFVREGRLNGCEGRLSRIDQHAIITVSDAIKYPTRRRFVIAHELGHFELHPDSNHVAVAVCTAADIKEIYDEGTEVEANTFASELLMPESLWKSEVDVEKPSLDVIRELAEDFEVSLTAAAIRFVKLCPERCAIVSCKENCVQWSVTGPEFKWWIHNRGSELDRYSLASDYFKDKKVSRAMETVSASAWLQHPKFQGDRDYVLREHCVPVPSLETTLSLLWIPSDAEF